MTDDRFGLCGKDDREIARYENSRRAGKADGMFTITLAVKCVFDAKPPCVGLRIGKLILERRLETILTNEMRLDVLTA
jgi:hypothetical protein